MSNWLIIIVAACALFAATYFAGEWLCHRLAPGFRDHARRMREVESGRNDADSAGG